jgi:hypothetical protein
MNNRNARRAVKRAITSTGRLLGDWIAATWDFFLSCELFFLGAAIGLPVGLLLAGIQFDQVRHDMLVLAVHLGPLLPACGVFNMLRYGRDVGRWVPQDDSRDEAIRSLTEQVTALNARLTVFAAQDRPTGGHQ